MSDKATPPIWPEWRRLVPALLLGYAAFAFAVGAGIPVWIDWPTWQFPADATDLGALVAIAVLHLPLPPSPKE